MVKFFVRILLSLCVVLSSGYSQLYAHKHQEVNTYTPSSIVDLCGQIKSGVKNSHDFFVKSLSSVAERDGFKFDSSDFEEEDDNIRSFKKYMDSSKYFAALFFARVLRDLFRYINPDPGLRYSKSFAHTESYRLHLMIEVFRI
ncbi:hypothetical protein KZP23_03155 [Echinicola marina]|uniref:hypothetical protein n=1 Tax=Echinicola marina TaxID=2859768 RepID=UPI001CF6F3AF|nr:hypothetical protein [Echinicola marina]UCS94046.1 hypothetical protein KZP23_03155 [Echinicola marina]